MRIALSLYGVGRGGVDLIGMGDEAACYIAEGIGELEIFGRPETGFFVKYGIAVDALRQPRGTAAEILPGKGGIVDQSLQLGECYVYRSPLIAQVSVSQAFVFLFV